MIFQGWSMPRSASCLRVLLQPEKPQLKRKSCSKRTVSPGERGAELVEVAFTIPILLGLIFGLMVLCLAFYTHAYISEVAREGSRYGALHGANCVDSYSGASCTKSPSQIETYVTSTGLPNLGGGTVSIDTADMFPDGDQVSPHRIQVKVTYVFPYKIPFVTSSNLTMSTTSVMTIVQ